ncbi:MAG: helix-turn-helix domain-containing protein [Novosphingobium sp.]
MSIEALAWALKQPVQPSTAKFVLVVIANCANGDEFIAWPSTEYLVEATGQDRKTVLANMRRLREAGYIEDTGERAGSGRGRGPGPSEAEGERCRLMR